MDETMNKEETKQTYYSIIYQYGHVANNTLYYIPIDVVKGTVDHESDIFTTDKGRNFKALDLGILESEEERVETLKSLLDGYFVQKPHHVNVNVFNRDLLVDAMHHPEKYPVY